MNLKSTFCLLEHGHLGTGGQGQEKVEELGLSVSQKLPAEVKLSWEASDQSSVPATYIF